MCQPCVIRGLTECYVVLPRSGTMRSGKLYRRVPSERPTGESESGLLPTPTVSDEQPWLHRVPRAKQTWEEVSNLTERLTAIHLGLTGHDLPPEDTFVVNPSFVEWMMGYPPGWTDLEDSATQSSPR